MYTNFCVPCTNGYELLSPTRLRELKIYSSPFFGGINFDVISITERLQTCYGNHNTVRIKGAYLGLPALIKFLHFLQWG